MWVTSKLLCGSSGSTGMTHFQPWFRAHLMDLQHADKCIIETGGVVGTTLQKYMLSICCSTLDAIDIVCWDFKW